MQDSMKRHYQNGCKRHLVKFCGFDFSDSEKGPEWGPYEHDNEPPGSMKYGKFHHLAD
jgi:hypothetical protein